MSDERLDATIDRVAREMTTGELPADFRDRVIARLERGDARHRPWRPALVLAPLAVAAVALLSVLVNRGPWQSDGPPEVRQEVRAEAPGDVVLKPVTSPGQAVDGLNTEASPTPSRVPLVPDPGFAGGANGGRNASDLAPAPIRIPSLEMEAMEATEAPPLSVDGMESIDVPGLDVAPLEVPEIGEE